jgi:hypothetical protein
MSARETPSRSAALLWPIVTSRSSSMTGFLRLGHRELGRAEQRDQVLRKLERQRARARRATCSAAGARRERRPVRPLAS